MNNKELAIDVFKHPLIQEILKQKLAESSVVNRLIVEEIMMEDELEEAKSSAYTNLRARIRADFNAALSQNKLDVFIKKYKEPLVKGGIPSGNWENVTDPKEKEQLLGFVNTSLEKAIQLAKESGSDGTEVTAQSTDDVPQSTEQQLTDVYLAQIKSRLKNASQTPYKLGNRADAALGLALIPLKVWGMAIGAVKDTGQLLSGINPLQLAGDAAQELINKHQTELLEQISVQAKKDPTKFLGLVNEYKPADANNDWIAKLEPVSEVKKLIASLAKEYELEPSDEEFKELEQTKLEKEKELEGSNTDPEADDVTNQQKISQNDVTSDFDKSDVEIPNLRYDEYIDSLDHFFGMREDKATSFMKAYFLNHQVNLLHNNLLSSLNNIKNPPTFEQGGQRAFSTAADNLKENLSEETKEAVVLDKKDKILLKRELADQADILLDAKKIALAYKEYGTSQSLDAEFDGSTLEKQLKVVLADVQKHNARLVSIISSVSNKIDKNKNTLQEATEISREQKIDQIEQVYKQMGNFYKNNLRISLENKEFKKAIQGADKLLQMVKPIIPFFPKTIVHSQSGRVISLSDAIVNLESKIKSYKKVLRDIYMTIKDDEVSPIQLSRMFIQLTNLCDSIADNFDVPCIINEKSKKNAEQNLPEQEQALTAIVTMDPEPEVKSGITLPEPSGPLDDEEEEIEAFPPQTGGTEEEGGQKDIKTILTQLNLPEIRDRVGIGKNTVEAEGLRFLAIALAAQELGGLPKIAGFNEDRSQPRQRFQLKLDKFDLKDKIKSNIRIFMTEFAKQTLPKKSVLKRGYDAALGLLDNEQNLRKVKDYLTIVYNKILNLKDNAKTFDYTGPESLVQQTTGVDLLNTLEEKLEPIIEQLLREKNG